jgi:hypothetical protein
MMEKKRKEAREERYDMNGNIKNCSFSLLFNVNIKYRYL